MATTEEVRTILRSAGLRCTPQRVAVYEALQHASHPTAEQLHDVVSQTMAISLATVYNTLEAFTTAGIILQLPSPSGCSRYCGQQQAHLHLRVSGSDEIMDVPMDLGQQIMQALPREVLSKIEDRMGVRIDSIDVQLSGARPTASQGE
ncbi:MAG: transcriptional repressor [Phycisphaerales bacterium]|nr:transcriptional repressor [Phycisphaerales bacterium]